MKGAVSLANNEGDLCRCEKCQFGLGGHRGMTRGKPGVKISLFLNNTRMGAFGRSRLEV